MIEPDNEKVVDVEDTNEDTNSLFNKSRDSEDGDFNNIFESLSDCEDDSLDSNVEKYVVPTKAKMREKRTTSPKKGNGMLVKKPISKATGKRKRTEKDDSNGPGPSS